MNFLFGKTLYWFIYILFLPVIISKFAIDGFADTKELIINCKKDYESLFK